MNSYVRPLPRAGRENGDFVYENIDVFLEDESKDELEQKRLKFWKTTLIAMLLFVLSIPGFLNHSLYVYSIVNRVRETYQYRVKQKEEHDQVERDYNQAKKRLNDHVDDFLEKEVMKRKGV